MVAAGRRLSAEATLPQLNAACRRAEARSRSERREPPGSRLQAAFRAVRGATVLRTSEVLRRWRRRAAVGAYDRESGASRRVARRARRGSWPSSTNADSSRWPAASGPRRRHRPLRGLAAGSVDLLTSFHLIEHLSIEVLLAMFEAAYAALRRGGCLLLETPSPVNVIMSACNFYLDPTHRSPLPPALTEHLVLASGFVDVECAPCTATRRRGRLEARGGPGL